MRIIIIIIIIMIILGGAQERFTLACVPA